MRRRNRRNDPAMPRINYPGFVSPGVGLISPLAPGRFKSRKLKRDRRCQVDSDPYGLPNWGRPLKGRINSAPAKDNVDPDMQVAAISLGVIIGLRMSSLMAAGLGL